jgi:hypothetical protein
MDLLGITGTNEILKIFIDPEDKQRMQLLLNIYEENNNTFLQLSSSTVHLLKNNLKKIALLNDFEPIEGAPIEKEIIILRSHDCVIRENIFYSECTNLDPYCCMPPISDEELKNNFYIHVTWSRINQNCENTQKIISLIKEKNMSFYDAKMKVFPNSLEPEFSKVHKGLDLIKTSWIFPNVDVIY